MNQAPNSAKKLQTKINRQHPLQPPTEKPAFINIFVPGRLELRTFPLKIAPIGGGIARPSVILSTRSFGVRSQIHSKVRAFALRTHANFFSGSFHNSGVV